MISIERHSNEPYFTETPELNNNQLDENGKIGSVSRNSLNQISSTNTKGLENKNFKNLSKNQNNIDIAFEEFDYWVKAYDQQEQTDPSKLLEWLSYQRNGGLITSYEEFVQLVDLLQKSGEYDIPEIPSNLEFEKTKLRYIQYRKLMQYAHWPDTGFKASQAARVSLALEQFDNWVKNGNHRKITDPSKLLIKWLDYYYNRALITNYEEFVELATLLNSSGKYDIPKIPSKLKFQKIMWGFASRTEFQQGERILLGFKKCNHWLKKQDDHGKISLSKLLPRWLYSDKGGELITNYEEFVKLVDLLQSEEYNIPEVPSELAFDKAMVIFAEITDKQSEFSQSTRIHLAFENFDDWINIEQHEETSLSKLLLRWLSSQFGGALIANYEEFVELVTQLRDHRQYNIPEILSERRFEEAMIKFAKMSNTNYVASQSTRIHLAFKKCNHWLKKRGDHGKISLSKLLTHWLYSEGGGELITNYEEFVDLATRLRDEGKYRIRKIPSNQKFEKAMKKFTKMAR